MLKIIEKRVAPLSEEAFSPYGRVVKPHTGIPTKSGENWTCFSSVDQMTAQSPLIIGIVYCDAMPDFILALEGHTSREELLWAATGDILMVVSKPNDIADERRQPKIDDTDIFLIKAGEAVIIGKGTWHSPAFCADGGSTFYYFLVENKADSIDQDAAPWIAFENGDAVKAVR